MSNLLGYIIAGLGGALLVAIGVIAALLRGRHQPIEKVGHEPLGRDNARAKPPRTLPTSIATKADYESDSLSTPELDPDAGVDERADWLDRRAAELAETD